MKENILVSAVLIAALIIFGILFSNERDCEFMLLSSRPDLLPLIDADMRALGV